MGTDEWTYHSTYRGIVIQVYTESATGITTYAAYTDTWVISTSLSAVEGAIDDFLGPEEPPEPYWEYHSTYRGIEIQVWMPDGTPFTAYFDGSWHTAAYLSTLQAAIDDFLAEEPPPEPPPDYDGVYIYLQPALDGAFLELHDRSFGGDAIVDTTNTVDGVAFFDGSPYPDFYAYEVRFPPQTIGGVSYLEALTPWFNFADPREYTLTLQEAVVVDGHIVIVKYWIDGMAGWEDLEVYPTKAKVGDEIHVYVDWVNDGSAAAVGHVLAQFKSPAFYVYRPDAVLNQDKSANPGGGWAVQFAPVTLDEIGSWEFYGQLKLDGVQVDFKKFTFAVEAPVGIPTTLTLSAPDIVGVDEKFNISGILYETESGIPIPNQPINHSYNGRSLGSSTTGVDGDYLKEVSIPKAGTWTIKSDFLGTETLQASKSEADAIVAASPLEAAIAIIASAATGLTMIAYSLS